MTVQPLRAPPDLGPIEKLPNPADPSSPLINVAAIVALARQGETPQARRLYAEFLRVWPDWKDRPLSKGEKQGGALKAAFAAVGVNLRLQPAPDRPG